MKETDNLKLWEIPKELHTGAIIALVVNGSVSVAGNFIKLNTMEIIWWQLSLITLSLLGLFILFDQLKRLGFILYLNSLLAQKVETLVEKGVDERGEKIQARHTKTRWAAGLGAGVLTLFLAWASIFGGWSLSQVWHEYIVKQEIAKDDLYQKELIDIKTGATAQQDYNSKISDWNSKTIDALNTWRADEAKNKKSWQDEKEKAYEVCNVNWKIAKHYYTKNRLCKEAWDKNNPYLAIAKTATLMKPIFVAHSKGTSRIIGDGYKEAKERAEKYARNFSLAAFIFWAISDLVMQTIIIMSFSSLFIKKLEDIEDDPKAYVKAYNHSSLVKKTERNGKSEAIRHKETETMVIRVTRAKAEADLAIDREKVQAAARLQQDSNYSEMSFEALLGKLRVKMSKESEVEQKYLDVFGAEPLKPVNNKEITKDEKVASKKEVKTVIGFRTGDELESTKTQQAKAPSFKENGYFDDGYDLTVALFCLFNYGKIGAGEKVLSNPQVKKLYDESPFKRNELNVNQIPRLVKAPLKEEGNLMLQSSSGGNDVALFSLNEIIEKLGLTWYSSEILNNAKEHEMKIPKK